MWAGKQAYFSPTYYLMPPCRSRFVIVPRFRKRLLTFPFGTCQDLSHNTVANEANSTDPWIMQKGSLRGLRDMLSGVRFIAYNSQLREI